MHKKYQDSLSEEQKRVLVDKATEAPFSGKYLDHDKDGKYICTACKTPLFSSRAKYESTTPGLIGWPSFSEVIAQGNVELKEDKSLLMKRTEVVCKKCGGHLGHVFDADDSPNGTHYCINSVSLDFQPDKK